MSFRFPCPRCGATLKANEGKVGRGFACPACRERVTVPTAELAGVQMAERQAQDPEGDRLAPFSEFAVFDDAELIYESELGVETTFEQARVPDRVAVSRWALYVQSVLIVFGVGVAFVMGLLVGLGLTSPTNVDLPDQPVLVDGSVAIETDGAAELDPRGFVALLPTEAELAVKIDPEELLKQIDGLQTAQRLLYDVGGRIARTDPSGGFQLTVPRQGEYYLLVLSTEAPATPASELDRAERKRRIADLGKMGNYLSSVDELTDSYGYSWSRVDLQQPRRLDVVLRPSEARD